MSDHKPDIADLLRTHGRADDLNALVEDTKRLKHSEREAVIAAQETCMKAAAEIERLRAELSAATRPDCGKFNRQRLMDKLADLQAQIGCTVLAFELDQDYMARRTAEKMLLAKVN